MSSKEHITSRACWNGLLSIFDIHVAVFQYLFKYWSVCSKKKERTFSGLLLHDVFDTAAEIKNFMNIFGTFLCSTRWLFSLSGNYKGKRMKGGSSAREGHWRNRNGLCTNLIVFEEHPPLPSISKKLLPILTPLPC